VLVSGVVSVSGETDLRSYGQGVPPLYAVPYEGRIRAPLLVVGSRADPLIGHLAVASLVGHAGDARAVLIPGTVHGWDLLQGASQSTRIRAAVARFLAHAGAAGRDRLPRRVTAPAGAGATPSAHAP
jgi:hypothetical protein